MTSLNKKQVNHLKKIAHHEKPIFQMGKEGLGQTFLDQVDQALTKQELIKFKVLQNSEEEIREVTAEIAYALDAYVVQVIGHTGVLYRPSHIAKYQKLSANLKKIK